MAKGICIPQFPLILSVWNMLGSCKESNAVSLLLNIALAASILRVWNFLYIIPVVFISCFIRKMLLGFSVRFHDDIWGVNSNKFLPSYEGLDMALPYPWSPWDFFVFSSWNRRKSSVFGLKSYLSWSAVPDLDSLNPHPSALQSSPPFNLILHLPFFFFFLIHTASFQISLCIIWILVMSRVLWLLDLTYVIC